MEGEAVSKPLSESDDWKGMVDMLGNDHPKAVILTENLGEFVAAFDSSGMVDFADFLVFIENFGRSVVN